ncbi:MAG: glycosyltransferase, partial [Armatimonadetes bacterium]|nr:glycosyltransferase [Armatimonadota bacterium]
GCGVRLPHGDTDALVEAVCRLAARPEECERMGRSARRALVRHYSLSQVAARYYAAMQAAISDAAGQAQRPPRRRGNPVPVPRHHGHSGVADRQGEELI